MSEELNSLIEQLETLELSLSETKAEVSHIRGRLQCIASNPHKHTASGRTVCKAESVASSAASSQDLDVGDGVRILNPVKLTEHSYPVHNCEGTIHRFTKKQFIIVRVYNKKRPSHLSGTYDEIRRERQNIKLLAVANKRNLIEDEQF